MNAEPVFFDVDTCYQHIRLGPAISKSADQADGSGAWTLGACSLAACSPQVRGSGLDPNSASLQLGTLQTKATNLVSGDASTIVGAWEPGRLQSESTI